MVILPPAGFLLSQEWVQAGFLLSQEWVQAGFLLSQEWVQAGFLLSQGQALLNAIQGQAFAGMVLVGDFFSLYGLLMWFRVPGDH